MNYKFIRLLLLKGFWLILSFLELDKKSIIVTRLYDFWGNIFDSFHLKIKRKQLNRRQSSTNVYFICIIDDIETNQDDLYHLLLVTKRRLEEVIIWY